MGLDGEEDNAKFEERPVLIPWQMESNSYLNPDMARPYLTKISQLHTANNRQTKQSCARNH